ncbi:hypothetical protein L7F22_008715 [Adiantum nelumboides]|nr:hypothetical protein [Adiantum nelumboides]
MPPAQAPSPHWLPLSPLGSGSSSHVSLALNLADGSLFAAKSASSHLLLHELSLLHSLHSPFIIQCLGTGLFPSSAGLPHLFLEYMHSGSLADVLRRCPAGRLQDENLVRHYTRAIVQGLDHLHQNGVVHCDIKSHNILIGQSGIKIGDFGAAKRIGSPEVEAMDGIMRGTPLWMAPEVLLSEEQGPPSDIWSLGCTVVEMLQGKPPWGHITNFKALLMKVGSSSENPPLPELASTQANDFLRNCLHRDPKARATASELLRHPFLCGVEEKLGAETYQANFCKVSNQPSPRSTLDVLYNSESDDDYKCESILASCTMRAAGQPSPAGRRSPAPSPAAGRIGSFDRSCEWVTVRRVKKCRNMSQVPFMLSAGDANLALRRGNEVSFHCAAFLQKRSSNAIGV